MFEASATYRDAVSTKEASQSYQQNVCMPKSRRLIYCGMRLPKSFCDHTITSYVPYKALLDSATEGSSHEIEE